MKSFIDTVLRLRVAAVLITLLITAGALTVLPDIKVNTDFLSFLPADDPDVVFFRETGETFGGNYMGMIIVQADDIFEPTVLHHIRDLSQAVEKVEGITTVMSLTDMMDIRKTDDGIEVSDLLPNGKIPETKEELAELRSYVLGKEMFTSSMVSKNGKATAIIVRIDEAARKDVVAKEIEDIANAVEGPGKLNFAGFPMVMNYTALIIEKDMTLLIPLVMLVIIFILFMSFRALRGVALPLVTVMIATIWALGAMAVFGAPITMISAILPVLLMANGTAYAIHVMNGVYHEYKQGDDSQSAIKRAFSKIGLPVLLSAFTTMIGFLALLSSTMTLFADFGLFSAVGIAAAFFIAVVFVPAILSWLKPKSPKKGLENATPRTDRALEAAAHFVARHRVAVVVVALFTVVGAGMGLTRIRTDVNFLSYFKENSPPRVAEQIMKDEWGGSTPVAVDIRGKIKDPLTLQALVRLGKEIRALPHVGEMTSIADLIVEMNDSLNDLRTVPDTQRGVASLWLLLEGKEELDQLITKDESEAMLQGRLDEMDSRYIREAVLAINAIVKDFPNELVRLHLDDVQEDKKAEFASRLADTVRADLKLDLEFRGHKFTDDGAVWATLMQAIHRLPPQLGSNALTQIYQSYLLSEDAELEFEVETEAVDFATKAAGTTAPSIASLTELLKEISPALVEEDEEGAELLAESMLRLNQDAVRASAHDGLLAQITDSITTKDKLSTRALADIKGDLYPAISRSLPVTPTVYLDLTGNAAKADAITKVQYRQTGLPVVLDNMDRQLIRSQVQSLGFALLMVLIMLMIQLRSLWRGLVALTPILFTVAVNFGIMGWLNIPVDNATMMIGSIAIGIGIDYTIHVATRLRIEMLAGGSQGEILARIFVTTGKAVLINALAVMAGFLVLLASEMLPLQVFGWLTAACMFLSALGALTLFPALALIPWFGFANERRETPRDATSVAK